MPPAPVAVGNIFRVGIFQRLAGQRVLNVLHARVDTVGAVTDYGTFTRALALDLAGEFGVGSIWEDWRNGVSSQLEFEDVHAQRIAPVRDVFFGHAIDLPGLYAGGGVVLSPNDAISITKRTLTFGRRGVGRMQVAGWKPDTITLGVYDIASVADADIAFDWLRLTYFAATADAELRWGLYNALDLGTPFIEIDDVRAEREVRTMHRRTVGLGE